MTSWAGMSSVTVRKSIRTARSRIGMMKIMPGPRNGCRRPSRKTTARSYSLRILRPLSSTIAAITITIPSPLTIGIPPFVLRRQVRGITLVDFSRRSILPRHHRGRRRNFGPHRYFESMHRYDARVGARRDRLVADRAPDFAIDEDLPRSARRDRRANQADLA